MKRLSAFDLAVALFLGYLATLPLPHVTALRNLFLYASVPALAYSLARRQVLWPRADKAVFLLLAYAASATLALFVTQVDLERSLREVRGELLVQLYILGFALLYLRNRPSPVPLLAALAAGFVLLVLLAALKLLLLAWTDPAQFRSATFHLREVVDNYGLNAQFYLPILLGALVALELTRMQRALLFAVALLGFALAVWYNTTSAVVLVSLHAIYVATRAFRPRSRAPYATIAILSLAVLAATVLTLKDERYRKIGAQIELLSKGKYFEMLSLRGGMWAIGADCAADAPWHGYGYGQKKVALLCSDEKYLGPARERGNFMADYFRADRYGAVSLHNQYLENWLIAGWFGALLWLAFFVAACMSAWRKRGPDGLQQLIVLPCLLIFLAGCFFNGLWEGPALAKGIMVILALALAPRPGQEARA